MMRRTTVKIVASRLSGRVKSNGNGKTRKHCSTARRRPHRTHPPIVLVVACSSPVLRGRVG